MLVVRARVKTRTEIGDGGHPAMVGPLRAHANNAEYVPMAILLLLILYSLGANVFVIHAVAHADAGPPAARHRPFAQRRDFDAALLRHDPDLALLHRRHHRHAVAGLRDLLPAAADGARRHAGDPGQRHPRRPAAGADAADALLVENVSASVSYRLGKLEDVERAESHDLACASSSARRSLRSSTIFSKTRGQLPGRPWRWQAGAEDKFAASRPASGWKAFPELDLEDKNEPAAETLVEWAAPPKARPWRSRA